MVWILALPPASLPPSLAPPSTCPSCILECPLPPPPHIFCWSRECRFLLLLPCANLTLSGAAQRCPRVQDCILSDLIRNIFVCILGYFTYISKSGSSAKVLSELQIGLNLLVKMWNLVCRIANSCYLHF